MSSETPPKDKPSEEKKAGGKSHIKKILPPKERSPYSVWIGNLPYTITRDELIEFFKPCGGKIIRVNIPKTDNKARGYAYVDFDSQTPHDLALAYSEQMIGNRAVLIKDANSFEKTGRPSRVVSTVVSKPVAPIAPKAQPIYLGKRAQKLVPKDPGHAPSPTLFIGGMKRETTVATLKKLFKPFGKLVGSGIRLATFEDNPGVSRGFAYVDFMYTEEATKAMLAMNGETVDGNRVRVQYAGLLATRKGRPWERDVQVREPREESDNKRRRVHGSQDSSSASSRVLSTGNMAETKLQGLPVAFEGKKITFGD